MTMTPTAAPATGGDQQTAPSEAPGKSRKKLIVVLLVFVLAAGGAGYWFLLRPGGGGHQAPVPGEVMVLDPVQVNLEGRHYLRVGIALQLTKGAATVDGSQALDATISLFSGRSMKDLSRSQERNRLKKQLESTLATKYEGEVMGIYFTVFVMQ